MTLENQVTSLELSKRLKELGVRQESLFWWHESRTNRSEKTGFESLKTGKFYLHQSKGCFSAFTASELDEILPDDLPGYGSIIEGRYGGKRVIEYPRPGNVLGGIRIEGESLVDMKAKAVIHLLENKLMTL